MNPIQAARAAGQQIWLDNLSRALISSGELARFIEMGVAGVTTNPAIFHKAIAEGRTTARRWRHGRLGAEARYEGLVIEDVQRACDVIRPVFEASQGDAGYVSLEVSPALADDEAGTVAAARRLRAAVARDNLLVKIPATAAGVRAIETLTGEGVSINVTLMFSLAHVEAVAGAYQRGLENSPQPAATSPACARWPASSCRAGTA
jgi:transaldolase